MADAKGQSEMTCNRQSSDLHEHLLQQGSLGLVLMTSGLIKGENECYFCYSKTWEDIQTLVTTPRPLHSLDTHQVGQLDTHNQVVLLDTLNPALVHPDTHRGAVPRDILKEVELGTNHPVEPVTSHLVEHLAIQVKVRVILNQHHLHLGVMEVMVKVKLSKVKPPKVKPPKVTWVMGAM